VDHGSFAAAVAAAEEPVFAPQSLAHKNAAMNAHRGNARRAKLKTASNPYCDWLAVAVNSRFPVISCLTGDRK
jgi:hypothetical protein